ncbi:O-antigen ligase family protein [Jatrophihabitans sp.]|uniref:O-antigen ligase family protein n=1 Tax=Jatrophihabitans sp. TaxID=1932789 RepID=UPI002C394007|nr:O-antigen ligase family protein [Jatrophihabitans sp.]
MSSGQQLSVEQVSVTAEQARPDARLRRGETVTWLLLAALAGAVLDQGGFYAGAQRVLGLALAAAVAVAMWSAARPVPRTWSVPAVTGFACAGWALLDGWLHGAPGSGVRPALLVVAAGAVIALCRWLDSDHRARLSTAVAMLGCLTGLLGWYGVASHSPAFALTGQGLWRAMGTLGYPNAAAAFLAVLLVGTVTRQVRNGSAHWPTALAGTALLVGLGATLSRGGLLATAAGLAALAALLGPRRVLAALWAPVLGAALALAGLLPGLAATAAPHPGLAAGTLAAGLVTGGWAPLAWHWLRSRMARLPLAFLGCLAVSLTGALLAATGAGSVLSSLRQARLTLSSADRVAAWQAVTDVIARHPVIGAGPGLRTFSWSDPHGGVLVFAYAHNEYLQVLAELGTIGLVLLLACLAALLRVLGRCRPRSAGGEAAAAAIAGLAVLCTSALFDFTGHFPAIVLTAAALVGCAEPAFRPRDSSPTS